MRGPVITPWRTASRTASVTRPRPPQSRTVVTPALSASCAFAAARTASMASLSLPSVRMTSSLSGPALNVRWTWASMNPGSSVR